VTEQLVIDGIGRCGYVHAHAHPARNDDCVLVCVAAPHGDDVAHHLEWQEVPTRKPVGLVVIEGGRL
jgi:hypothetical protein